MSSSNPSTESSTQSVKAMSRSATALYTSRRRRSRGERSYWRISSAAPSAPERAMLAAIGRASMAVIDSAAQGTTGVRSEPRANATRPSSPATEGPSTD